ncbi:hypothetical protein J1N35_023823 [Gossypium stocksii]|uniref:DUF946 domain-containing protein n=1 Tax=Gossypium stocksii TaxID=47602 RepID=A0A9D3VKQ6_9ROSI|nr:hypothetical protein J1N35_023823 [Gossypium stocksii]
MYVCDLLILNMVSMGNYLKLHRKRKKALPIETVFKLPAPLPTWPPGEGFAKGIIDLGGLQVCQISTFTKVWVTYQGGPDDLGATFFEPSLIPDGFHMLASYGQSNNRLLSGSVLVAKDDTNNQDLLIRPVDYSLIWTSESLGIKQDTNGYIWLPVASEGYRALGHVVTNTEHKPPIDKIRCVRSDFTDEIENQTWIWGLGKESNANELKYFTIMPMNRGPQQMGVCVGSFIAQNPNNPSLSHTPLACLRNKKPNYLASMPNIQQIETLFQAYSPLTYFHPKETYLPSSVNWFFINGGLLYTKENESNPVPIEPTGSNLPQGGSNDGNYWLDLPINEPSKERVKKGDLKETQVYLHVKPMLGATYTDIQIWVFYPFNGGAKAKAVFIDIPLGKIGEHVGDWEHLTLRISNFTGELQSVYFSAHSGGSWVTVSELEFKDGNKPCAYSSLHGHAMYSKPGLVLQGKGTIGIRNDTAKSKILMDTGVGFVLVAGEYLGNSVVEPPWLNYCREWGPKVSYDLGDEIKKVGKLLPGFEKFMKSLPKEVLGEEGPTGPKMKRSWDGDEV